MDMTIDIDIYLWMRQKCYKSSDVNVKGVASWRILNYIEAAAVTFV